MPKGQGQHRRQLRLLLKHKGFRVCGFQYLKTPVNSLITYQPTNSHTSISPVQSRDVKYKLAKALDLFWCYSTTCCISTARRKETMGGVPSWLAPLHLPFGGAFWQQVTAERFTGVKSKWAHRKTPFGHVNSCISDINLCALCFSCCRNTAKIRAGQEPLKADLQLTAMSAHRHCLKMLNPGFFCLVLSSSQFPDAPITCSICL